MENYFINYNQHTGLGIDTFRNPSASVGEITDLVEAVKNGDESVVCQLEGAQYALEDGMIWGDGDQDVLEEVHDLIIRFKE